MNKQIKHLAALAALSLLGATSGQASVLGGDAAGGSEAILSLANTVGDSISQDLGTQTAGLSGNFALSAGVLNFINAAGAANVTFSIIAGSTTTRTYLTSSASATFADDSVVGNGAKSLWASTINGYVGALNLADATGSDQNLTYGPFPAGSGGGNFIDGGYDTWQSGDFQFSSLGSALDPLYLYTTTFLTANTGTVPFTPFKDGLFAKLNLTSNQLQLETTAVPAPAAVWLLGTALVPLARRAYRKSRNPA